MKTLSQQRTAPQIAADILELTAIKKAYSHYLASYESQLYCDNTLQVRANMETVKESLIQLNEEMTDLKLSIMVLVAPKPVKETIYEWSAAEINAVNHFNKDPRYGITE